MELEIENEESMGKKFNVLVDEIIELCDIHNKLRRVMRHMTVSRSDTEKESYRKELKKMVHSNKIRTDKLKDHIDTIYKENSPEKERSIISQMQSSQIKCTLNLNHTVKYM